VLTFVFAAVLFMIGFVFPKIYYPLRLPEGHFALDPEGERAQGIFSQKEKEGESAPEESKDKVMEDEAEKALEENVLIATEDKGGIEDSVASA